MPIHIDVHFGPPTLIVALGAFLGAFLTTPGAHNPDTHDGAEEGTPGRPDDPSSSTLTVAQSLASRISVLVGPSLSITSSELHTCIATALATPASARALLMSALHERGWAGLTDITGDAVSLLGMFQGRDVPYEESLYLHQFICYVVLDVICRQFDLLNGPVLLRDVASDIALCLNRIDSSSPNVVQSPLSASSLFFGDTTTTHRAVQLILSPITTSLVPLVLALMHQLDKPRVWHAFRLFARNPTSFRAYLYPAPGMTSVKQIVDATAASIAAPSPQPSFRTLTVAPRVPGRNAGQSLAMLKDFIRMMQGSGTGEAGSQDTADLEAGLICDGDELRYASALIVVALTPGLSN